MNLKIWVLGLLGLLALYGFAYEPYSVEKVIHQVGKGEVGLRVVQLSDLHLRGLGRREQVVIEELAKLKPDLVVLSGDVVDRRESIAVLERFLGQIPKVDTVAVLGCVFRRSWTAIPREAGRTFQSKLDSRRVATRGVWVLHG